MSNGEELRLLPCPFCGGPATLNHSATDDFDVSCRNRDCFGPRTASYGLFADVAYAWNRRSSPSAVEAAEVVAYVPTILRMGEEYGDPHWQFVLRDVATITSEPYAANVESLIGFDGKLVGFKIYASPPPASPSAPQWVEVKPLEWSTYLDYGTWRAKKPFGSSYHIEQRDDLKYDWNGTLFDELDDAKEACQADYRARILSAIQTSPEAGR